MKKLLCAVLVLVTLTLCWTSCGGEEVLGILPSYTGLPVTTTDYEFTKEDFYVLANYANRDEAIEDYEFHVDSMKDGYFILHFSYKGVTNLLYVKCEVPIYPSDMEN